MTWSEESLRRYRELEERAQRRANGEQVDPQPGQNKSALGDFGTALKAGVQEIPSAITGLLDIPVAAATGSNYVSRGADWLGDKTGLDFDGWAEKTRENYSPTQQQFLQEANQKEGFWDTAGHYLSNPLRAAVQGTESIPSIGLGGAYAKALKGATSLGTAARFGIGEGAVMAGQAMNEMVDDGVDPRRAAAFATGVGVLGGAFGYGGGRLSERLGLTNPDVLFGLGGRAVSDVAAPVGRSLAARTGSMAGRVAGGAITEGVFEEMPQSAMEAVMGNLAAERPWDEGVGKAAATGMVMGGILGGVVNIPGARNPVDLTQDPGAPPTPPPEAGTANQVLALPNNPLPPMHVFPDGSVARNQAEIDAYNAMQEAKMRQSYAPQNAGLEPVDLFNAEQGSLDLQGDGVPPSALAGVLNPYDAAGYVSGFQQGQVFDPDNPQGELFGPTESTEVDAQLPNWVDNTGQFQSSQAPTPQGAEQRRLLYGDPVYDPNVPPWESSLATQPGSFDGIVRPGETLAGPRQGVDVPQTVQRQQFSLRGAPDFMSNNFGEQRPDFQLEMQDATTLPLDLEQAPDTPRPYRDPNQMEMNLLPRTTAEQTMQENLGRAQAIVRTAQQAQARGQSFSMDSEFGQQFAWAIGFLRRNGSNQAAPTAQATQAQAAPTSQATQAAPTAQAQQDTDPVQQRIAQLGIKRNNNDIRMFIGAVDEMVAEGQLTPEQGAAQLRELTEIWTATNEGAVNARKNHLALGKRLDALVKQNQKTQNVASKSEDQLIGEGYVKITDGEGNTRLISPEEYAKQQADRGVKGGTVTGNDPTTIQDSDIRTAVLDWMGLDAEGSVVGDGLTTRQFADKYAKQFGFGANAQSASNWLKKQGFAQGDKDRSRGEARATVADGNVDIATLTEAGIDVGSIVNGQLTIQSGVGARTSVAQGSGWNARLKADPNFEKKDSVKKWTLDQIEEALASNEGLNDAQREVLEKEAERREINRWKKADREAAKQETTEEGTKPGARKTAGKDPKAAQRNAKDAEKIANREAEERVKAIREINEIAAQILADPQLSAELEATWDSERISVPGRPGRVRYFADLPQDVQIEIAKLSVPFRMATPAALADALVEYQGENIERIFEDRGRPDATTDESVNAETTEPVGGRTSSTTEGRPDAVSSAADVQETRSPDATGTTQGRVTPVVKKRRVDTAAVREQLAAEAKQAKAERTANVTDMTDARQAAIAYEELLDDANDYVTGIEEAQNEILPEYGPKADRLRKLIKKARTWVEAERASDRGDHALAQSVEFLADQAEKAASWVDGLSSTDVFVASQAANSWGGVTNRKRAFDETFSDLQSALHDVISSDELASVTQLPKAADGKLNKRSITFEDTNGKLTTEVVTPLDLAAEPVVADVLSEIEMGPLGWTLGAVGEIQVTDGDGSFVVPNGDDTYTLALSRDILDSGNAKLIALELNHELAHVADQADARGMGRFSGSPAFGMVVARAEALYNRLSKGSPLWEVLQYPFDKKYPESRRPNLKRQETLAQLMSIIAEPKLAAELRKESAWLYQLSEQLYNDLSQAPTDQAGQTQAVQQQNTRGVQNTQGVPGRYPGAIRSGRRGTDQQQASSNQIDGAFGAIVSYIAEKAFDAKTWAAERGLGWLSLTQLVERGASVLPSIKTYKTASDAMESYAKRMIATGAAIERSWLGMDKTVDKLTSDLMRETTRAQFDPDKETPDPTSKYFPNQEKLKKKWDALPKAGQDKYREVRDFFEKAMQERVSIWSKMLDATFGDQIKDAEQAVAEAKTPKAKRRAEAALDAIKRRKALAVRKFNDTTKSIRGPYFPLSRFGRFITVLESAEYTRTRKALEAAKESGAPAQELRAKLKSLRGKKEHYQVQAFDSAAQAKRAAEKPPAGMVGRWNVASEHIQRAGLEGGMDMGPIQEYLADHFDEVTVQQIQHMMSELYFASLPEGHALKDQMEREGIYGEDTDMRRAFSAAAASQAHYISRLKHMTDVKEAMSALKKESKRGVKAKNFYNEIVKRAQLDMNFTNTPIQDLLVNTSYFAHLGFSPAYVTMNMAQTPMITLPWLVSKHRGVQKVTTALAGAYADAGRMVKASFTSEKDANSLAGKVWGAAGVNPYAELDFSQLRDPQERELMQRQLERNLLDITMTHDLSADARHPGQVLDQSLKIANLPVHVTELLNRATTSLAAYRLARADGMSHDAAMEHALKAVEETQLNYAMMNKPRYFREGGGVPFAKMVFQFRMYQQGMLYLIGKSTIDAVKNRTDLSPAEAAKLKSEARRMLVGLFVTHGTMTGALGLPAMGTVLSILGWALTQLGDDDEPVDLKVELRNWLADTFGQEVGLALSKGLWSALGTDMSVRMGLGDIASPMPFFRADGKTGQESLGRMIVSSGGASLSMIAGFLDAKMFFEDGQYAKGFEKAVPLKGIKDYIRAYRLSEDGVTTRSGETALAAENFGPWAIALRGMGFSPILESEHYAAKSAVESKKRAAQDARTRLLRRYAQAQLKGDPTTDIMEEIRSFNERHPTQGLRIDRSSLLRAVQSRRTNQANTNAIGVRVDRGSQPFEQYGRFAGG